MWTSVSSCLRTINLPLPGILLCSRPHARTLTSDGSSDTAVPSVFFSGAITHVASALCITPSHYEQTVSEEDAASVYGYTGTL